ncbi:MAG: hypothetical protein RL235_1081 [Chlamydiota bacterium]
MAALVDSSTRSYPRSYQGLTASIEFQQKEQGLTARIVTERLEMVSIVHDEETLGLYAGLFNNKDVCQFYGTHQPWGTKAEAEAAEKPWTVAEKVNMWATRWQQSNPYSAFTVWNRETKAFVGHAVVGLDTEPGYAQIAGAGYPEYWQQGYGAEAMAALLEYTAAAHASGHPINGVPLQGVRATASPENTASITILQRLMVHEGSFTNSSGHPKERYVLKVEGGDRILPQVT